MAYVGLDGKTRSVPSQGTVGNRITCSFFARKDAAGKVGESPALGRPRIEFLDRALIGYPLIFLVTSFFYDHHKPTRSTSESASHDVPI